MVGYFEKDIDNEAQNLIVAYTFYKEEQLRGKVRMKMKEPSSDPKINERRKRGREYMKGRRTIDEGFAEYSRESAVKVHWRRKLKEYGLTEDDFEDLLKKQKYKCGICGNPFTLTVGNGSSRVGKPHFDHDHATGKLRGLLCQTCNLLIGYAGDNIINLMSARHYLESYGVNTPRKAWSGSISGKIWGKTTTYIKTPLFELHRIEVTPNSYCSLHKHVNKINTFVVISGILFIDVHKNDYDLVDTTELHELGVLTVKPGEFHQFRTGSIGAEALELYYNDPLSDADIIRKTSGGIDLNDFI